MFCFLYAKLIYFCTVKQVFRTKKIQQMKNIFAIGGLGGSGTRVVAEVLLAANVYLGDDLTDQSDNLIFTRLFKNPHWVMNSSDSDLRRRLRIFEKYMSGEKWTFSESLEYYHASQANPQRDKTKRYHLLLAAKKLLPDNQLRQFWGWKEPNTVIFLKTLFGYFENLKYIHVIRHGLDMAFSDNRQQLLNWGVLFGLQIENVDSPEELIAKQLDYWIKTNKHISKICSDQAVDRYLVINYSDFCHHPEIEIPRLLKFLNINVGDVLLKRIIQIPKIPQSEGRYKEKNISMFSESQLNQVSELGFEVDCTLEKNSI